MLSNGTITTMRDYAEQHSFDGDNVDINESLTTLSKTGQTKHGTASKAWKRESPDELLEITTTSGREIKVTPNHPLFTTNNAVIFAREANEYDEGDRIAVPRRQEVKGELQRLETKDEKHYNNSRNYNQPSILTPRLAGILGYLTGDGYLAENESSAWVSFTNENQALISKYQEDFNALFKQRLTRREDNGTHELYVTSQGLYNYLDRNFPSLTKPSDAKAVPAKIQRSKDEVIKAYLSAYFDADGYVNAKKRHVSITTTSKDLADHVSYLLQRLGIVARKRTKQKRATNTEDQKTVEAHQLIITPGFAQAFNENIGFNHPDKQEALEHILSGSDHNTNIDTIPGVENLLKHIRKQQGRTQAEMGIPRSTYAHYEQGNREPSRTTLQTIVDHIDNQNTWSYKALKQTAEGDIFWDKIKSIEKVASHDDYVYDFQVEQTHNYVANGVIAHNSQMLKRISHVAPKSRFVSGKGSTGAGLTASVVKDEFLKGWALEAGALVLANKGIACIDELDKMEEEDASAMHEALEQQSITISKANIQATLKAQTTVLAAANPKYGRFDPYDVIAKQIDMPSTLINRFDLIFPIRDIPDQEKDRELSSFILDLHRDDQDEEPPYSTNFMKRYIAFARQRVAPSLTDEALEEIQDYFVSMRNQAGQEERIQSVPISARQLEGLVRLATASAKTRLSTTVDREDAERAVELLHYCLTQIGYDEETGKFDIDKIETGTTASERSQISVVKELITELEEKNGGSVPLEDLYQEAEAREIDEHDAEEIIEKLKRKGDIYEPTSGYISRIQ
jgi:replicative DNA helicase Mcm